MTQRKGIILAGGSGTRRYPPAPGHSGHQQAIAAGVRQTHGLLPAQHADGAGLHHWCGFYRPPSARGELEITDLNRLYLEREQLARPLAKDGYGQYLLGLLGERVF